MSTVVVRVLLLLTALQLAAPAVAHQQKEAVTRVLFNAHTGNIEVMHRFLLHDAEHAASALFKDSTDLLARAADRERFAAYVHEGFSMFDQDQHQIRLQPVGHEIEGRFLWVYAEAPIPSNLRSLRLTHEALREVWPEQVNLVNVEQGDRVRSAVFDGGSREVTIDL
ncbi:MAG: DUF6702 family protein [Pseudomonadota bacterium]